jgi:hypothetical protein
MFLMAIRMNKFTNTSTLTHFWFIHFLCVLRPNISWKEKIVMDDQDLDEKTLIKLVTM